MTWCVVNTRPKSEAKAAFHLKSQGIEVYLPQYRKKIRHARKEQLVMRPLFPGYLFVEFSTAESKWRSISGTIGVSGLVTMGQKPALMSSNIVERIKSYEYSNGLIDLNDLTFNVGDRVKVIQGPFEDCQAILMEKDDRKRVVLLLDMMNSQVRIRTDERQLAAV